MRLRSMLTTGRPTLRPHLSPSRRRMAVAVARGAPPRPARTARAQASQSLPAAAVAEWPQAMVAPEQSSQAVMTPAWVRVVGALMRAAPASRES